MGRNKLLLALLLLVLTSGCVEGQVCAQDVRTCPDGSFVGRNPANNCQFDPCPSRSQCGSGGMSGEMGGCSQR